jgi:hypothetical protein
MTWQDQRAEVDVPNGGLDWTDILSGDSALDEVCVTLQSSPREPS